MRWDEVVARKQPVSYKFRGIKDGQGGVLKNGTRLAEEARRRSEPDATCSGRACFPRFVESAMEIDSERLRAMPDDGIRGCPFTCYRSQDGILLSLG